MHNDYLDFEQPIAKIQEKIDELRIVAADGDVNIFEEIRRLEDKITTLTKNIFSNLTPWQTTQLARHPRRPQFTDYLANLFDDFHELHGDRHYSDAPQIITGLAKFASTSVLVVGNQKGKTTAEKVKRNFGMAKPEAYRKTQRTMQLAEKFNLPIITFIDTAGAYAGIGAEERNQSEAIAKSIALMTQLKTPIITVITGEGGSGGALAIGVADRFLMMQYSVYSVITPEGCSSILWKDVSKAPEAAAAMGMTAASLKSLGLIDDIITEPLGGSHRNISATMHNLKLALGSQLADLLMQPIDQLVSLRQEKMLSYGI